MPLKRKPFKEVEITKGLKRGQRSIKKENILHDHLYGDIRQRLKLKIRELPNHKIRKIAKDINRAIGDWVVDNPEGFRMPNDMGVLAVSKFILIPFREDRFEIINRIKNLTPDEISERFRQVVLRKYGQDLNRATINTFMAKGKVVLVPMWFNHRNCSIRKAPVFKWIKSERIRLKLAEADTTNFYHLNFHDYHDNRVKALDSYLD